MPDHKLGLRIALLVEASSAGVGRHVIDLAEGLTHRGHLVHVLYSERRIDSNFRAGVERLAGAGVATASLDMAHNLHPLDVVSVFRLRNYLKWHGPFDLLHCHSTKAGMVGRLAALITVCPAIYTPNAFVTMSPFTGLVSRLGARVLEAALGWIGAGVICVSEEEEAHARVLGLPRDRVFMIPNGVDLSSLPSVAAQRTRIRRQFGLSEHEICVGFVGRLVPQKAPAFLVDAFAKALPVTSKAVKLIIAGDGPLLASLRAQVERLGLGDRVVFASGMSGVLAMSAFDIFALPSSFEGFPYVLVEATAMGLPVVSTAVGGTRALVRSGENGFVVPVGAVQQFGDCLQQLLADDDLRERMAALARIFSARFTLDRMLNETVQVYQRILETSDLRAAVGNSP